MTNRIFPDDAAQTHSREIMQASGLNESEIAAIEKVAYNVRAMSSASIKNSEMPSVHFNKYAVLFDSIAAEKPNDDANDWAFRMPKYIFTKINTITALIALSLAKRGKFEQARMLSNIGLYATQHVQQIDENSLVIFGSLTEHDPHMIARLLRCVSAIVARVEAAYGH